MTTLTSEGRRPSFLLNIELDSKVDVTYQCDFFIIETPSKEKKRLFWHCWVPSALEVRACVVLFHGIHEHSGRYQHLVDLLCANGVAVFAFDYYGHGHSAGKSGYVDTFETWIKHGVSFVELVIEQTPEAIEQQQKYSKSIAQSKTKAKTQAAVKIQNGDIPSLLSTTKGKPVFLFGQGIGGTIALHIGQKKPFIKGVIMSAPLLQIPQDTHAILQKIASIVATVTPYAQVVEVNYTQRCHNEEEIKKFKEDSLCHHDKMRASTGFALLKHTRDELPGFFPSVTSPFLLLQGSDDRYCDPKGARALYDKAQSADKTLQIFDGFWHDLLHEVCCSEMIKSILDWLLRRIATPESPKLFRRPSRI